MILGTFWWRSVVLWSREAREVIAEVRRGWERRQEARGEVASCWDSWQGGLGGGYSLLVLQLVVAQLHSQYQVLCW